MDMMDMLKKQSEALSSMKPDGTCDLNSDFKTILALDEKLTQAGIPHSLERMMDGWIVCYPAQAMNRRIGDAIQHCGSYGAYHDLVEVYGFGLKKPDGWCDADKAFEYFKTAHERAQEKERKRAERKKR